MTAHPWVAGAGVRTRFAVQLWNARGFDGDGQPVRHETPVRTLLEAARVAEAAGLDGVFVDDHPLVSLIDPWPLLSAVAATTGRVWLGSMVNCVSYRHPAQLARLTADLDELSGGRLVLGLGIGWAEDDFRALDVAMGTMGERHRALEEALAIIDGAWGSEPFSFSGRTFRTEGMRLFPDGVRRPRPPVLIAGRGERVTLRQVARFADACNVLESAAGGVDDLRHKFSVLERHCEEVGRPYDEVLRTHRGRYTLLAPTEAEARAKLASHVADDTPPRWRAAVTAMTPEQAVEHFRERAGAGVQYFVVMVDAADHETVHLLANDVAPHVA